MSNFRRLWFRIEKYFLLVMILVYCVFCIDASPVMDGTQAKAWTPDDILLAESASGWSFSPDGSHVAWIQSAIDKSDGGGKRISTLFITSLADNHTRTLMSCENIIFSPVFSPDGKRLAFLSNRKPVSESSIGGIQIWAVAMTGDEPFQVTRFERGVRNFAWKDAQNFVVAAQESMAPLKKDRAKKEDDTIIAGDAEQESPVRLFIATLEGGHAKRLTENNDWIRSLSVDAQGKTAMVSLDQDLAPTSGPYRPQAIYFIDLTNGVMKKLSIDAALRPSTLRWSPDGKGFYFLNRYFRNPKQRWPGIVELYYYDRIKEKLEKVDTGWARGLGRGLCPTADGVITFLVDGVYFRPVKLKRRLSGWRKIDFVGPHVPNFTAFEADRSGKTMVYEYSKPNLPPQWYSAKLDGAKMVEERQITELNKHFQGKPLGRVEIVTWKGERDEQVEGILYYPFNYQAGMRYPLVLDIHGGPTSSNLNTWYHDYASPAILWQQKGAFVLQANYHGSLGYGLDWVESIGGHFLELEIIDLEKGVDTLIQRGLVDPDKLATSGWSNGGSLSISLITHTTRYKAASVGSAIVEYASMWGADDGQPAFDNYVFGSPPWDNSQAYIDKSPFFKLTKVTTPTIVLSGTAADRNVPPYQSWLLYRGLLQIGKAPVRLVLFPGEAHNINGIVHQRRMIQENMKWFDHYLFGKVSAAENTTN